MYRLEIQLTSLTLLAILCLGCAGMRPPTKGPDPCQVATDHLKQRLGPEFGQVRGRTTSKKKGFSTHGCALVYTRVAEEMPDELPDGDGLLTEIDERVAIMLFREKGASRFRRLQASPMSPGSVQVKLKSADITGDGVPDFIIEERARVQGDTLGYRGLRIVDGRGASGQLIFEKALRIKTVEGLELIPRWSLVIKGANRSIVFKGGGETVEFPFNDKTGRFQAAAKPKPKAKPKATSTKPRKSGSTEKSPK